LAFSVLLTLDAPSDAAVNALAGELLGSNVGAGIVWSRPHISLAISETLDVEAFLPELREIASAYTPQRCAMSSLGFFPGAKRVCFLAPIVTQSLIDLHRAVDERFARHATRVDGNYRPPKWVPHCTLAMGLDSEAMGPVLDAYARLAMPLEGRFEQLELVEFVPVKVLETLLLGA
jgi:2'-5' RNA ligase